MHEQSYLKELFALDCSENEGTEILTLRTWFNHVAVFDPVTGNALSQDTVSLLSKAGEIPPQEWQDRLHRLCTYGEDAFQYIFNHLKRQILREHEVLPIYAARELDTASLLWMNRKPGRTVREKLGEKQKVMAVKRRWSIDTLENRLLKATAKRLADYLTKRLAFTEDTRSLYTLLRRWLQGSDAADIGPWTNLPPNNTLLHEKHYRKVWNIWGLLRHIDDDVARDHALLRNNSQTAALWQILAALVKADDSRIVQMPIEFNYDTMDIKPALNAIQGFDPRPGKGAWFAFTINGNLKINYLNGKTWSGAVHVAEVPRLFKELFGITMQTKPRPLSQNVPFDASSIDTSPDSIRAMLHYTVIDLCSIRPDYVTERGIAKLLPFRLLRQEWTEGGGVDCGEAQAVLLNHPDTTIQTHSMLSLFTSPEKDASTLTTASFFLESIKSHFGTASTGVTL
ncbi:hypothetical protein FACS189442_5570 [Spirochaetia bacterium]|nr:hypothetical protein FACS189442_5570 [Spirochaetia bacterium]